VLKRALKVTNTNPTELSYNLKELNQGPRLSALWHTKFSCNLGGCTPCIAMTDMQG